MSSNTGVSSVFTDEESDEIRSWFPLALKRVYLDSCSKGALCTQVRGSLSEFLRTWDQFGAPWDLWLSKIDEALKRLEKDEYGNCRTCGNQIGKKRLNVIPWASLCIECKEKEERGES